MATAAARRYAKAVFELAEEERALDAWADRLARIKVLFADPGVASVVSNPTIATEQREGLVMKAPGVLDAEATNLARLLIEAGRIADAADIEEEFERLADEAAGRVRATATTAVELSAEERERVARDLSKRLNKDVRLSVAVDPRILGGLKLQYGDRVIDASLASKLQQLRRRLAAT